MLKCYSSSSSESEELEQKDVKMEAIAPKQQKKLFSIKGALAMIDHAGVNSDDEESGVRRHMKLSRKEEEMMGHVKSKMRYAGETYHRVAAPEIEISKYTVITQCKLYRRT